jgi:hypothetical protein
MGVDSNQMIYFGVEISYLDVIKNQAHKLDAVYRPHPETGDIEMYLEDSELGDLLPAKLQNKITLCRFDDEDVDGYTSVVVATHFNSSFNPALWDDVVSLPFPRKPGKNVIQIRDAVEKLTGTRDDSLVPTLTARRVVAC